MMYFTKKVYLTFVTRFLSVLVIIVVGITSNVHAQLYPIQVVTEITPPYSIYLSDYTTVGSNKLNLNLLLTDVTRFNYPVKLKLIIEGEGITITTSASYMPEQIILDGGSPLRLSGDELAAYFNPKNLDFKGYSKEKFNQTGALPEGIYRIGFQVFDYNKNIAVSSFGAATAWLVLNDPPMFNIPEKNVKLTASEPQNIMFQWMPRHLGSPNSAFNAEYVFQLYEIWPDGRNPNEVVASTQPLIENTGASTTLLYSNTTQTPLLPGRQYAYRVQAKDVEGRDLFRNHGYSEVQMFTYGDPCDVPTQIDAQNTSSGNILVNWQATPFNTAFYVQYREANNPTAEWFPKNTYTSTATLTGLKPEMKYEYQVRGVCGAVNSDFSDLLYISTPKLREPKVVCGQLDSAVIITNHVPCTSLLPGDIITTGKFATQVTQASGGNGKWTGEGFMHVPLLGTKVHVMFKNISINEKLQVTSGRIESVYNISNKFDNKPNPASKTDSTKQVTPHVPTVRDTIVVNAVDTIYKAPNGDVKIVDNNGDTTTIHRNNDGSGVIISAQGDSTMVKAGDPVVIKDNNGNTTVVDRDGNITSGTHSSSTASAENPVNPKFADFYLVYTVKHVLSNTFDFYYLSSKETIDDNVISKMKKSYSDGLMNSGAIETEISELKRSDGIVTGNDTLEVRYIQDYRIIKVGDKYYNNYEYTENKVQKKYVVEIQVNEVAGVPNNINTLMIYNDKNIVLNVKEQGSFVLNKVLEFKVLKIQQRTYAVLYDKKAYLKDELLSLTKCKQITLKLVEKEPSGNIKELELDEIKWNNDIIKNSSEYSLTPDNEIKLVISFKNEKRNILLSMNIKTQDPFIPGITINYDNKSDIYKYITCAEEKISKNKNDSVMYNYLVKRNIVIDLLPSIDAKLAGVSSWNNQSEMIGLHFDTKSLNYKDNCICNPIILTKFVPAADVDSIKNAFKKLKIPNYILYQQVKLANIKEITFIENLIKAKGDTIKNPLYNSDFFKLKKIYRSAADTEINEYLTNPQFGSVTLYFDWFNTNVQNSHTFFKTASTPTDEDLFKKYYTQKLAHELRHLYYEATNQIETAKWSLMRDAVDKTVDKTKLCDDFSDSYGQINCSKGKGHEKNNPEGQAACSEESNY